MTKRTQLEEIRLLRRALADLYMVHTGRGPRDRLAALMHLHCPAGRAYDLKQVETGVLTQSEYALRETHQKGY